MARLKKSFAALPTHKLRNKVWARAVKLDLLPDSDPARPYAHLICEALNQRNIEQGGVSFGTFFTDTRWLDWWNGAHPTPGKYKAIAKVLPDSEFWFQSHMAFQDEHPMHTLLYALDILGDPLNETRAGMTLLLDLQDKWGARVSPFWDGYLSPQFPSAPLPGFVVFEHYSFLAPASIIRHMCWIGEVMRIEQTPQFKCWVFDLVSAAIAVFAHYNVSGTTAMQLSGTDGDITGFLYRTFTRPTGSGGHFIDQNVLRRQTKIVLQQLSTVLPASSEFESTIISAVELFVDELALYGFVPSDIRTFDPGLYSKKPKKLIKPAR